MRLWEAIKRLFAPTERQVVGDDLPPEREEFPLRDELDLHGLPPRLISELVASYLEEARRHGFTIVRVVHGKGIGFQREVVRKVMAASPHVVRFGDAPADAGGWGATLAELMAGEDAGASGSHGETTPKELE